jgi:UDP-2-acetamido-2,6-beta-L-arabino-hexul-4-ose reductase
VHLVLIEPGAVRGNHYHPRGSEIFTVTGPALVRTRNAAELQDTVVPEGQAYRFEIPSGVSHAIACTGRRAAVLVAFSTELHDPHGGNTISDVILERI